MQQRPKVLGNMRRIQPVSIEETLERFAWFEEMRTTSPVFYNKETNHWEVFLYEDVNRIMTDYADFSNEEIPGFTQGSLLEDTVVGKDPPIHRQLRNLINQAFTPRAVNHLSERVSQISQDLLDPLLAAGRMDVVADIAFPLPAKVIAAMLGVPDEDWDIFRRWVGAPDAPHTDPKTREEAMQERQQSEQQMYDYFSDLLDARRRSPREDLISSLSVAEIDGERLSPNDLVSFCILLLAAGQETTKNLIANAIYCFTEHPEASAQLIEHPELMPSAIEEVLRYMPPVWFNFRRTKNALDLRGQHIPANAILQVWQASANHDPAQFPDPERFDIQRSPNRHIAFGHGIHFCIGAPLARLEARVGLQMMLAQLPNLQRVPGTPINVIASLVYIIQSLPITFDARP
jgi:cytochrome P450